jgi:hypothetical protein
MEMQTKTCSQCHETKPIEDFPRQKQNRDGRFSWCKKCKNARQKAHYEANIIEMREKALWRQKEWRYGINREQFEALVAAQEGRCAICNEENGDRAGTQSLVVDHDHENGMIRGLLCHRCNMALGLLEDDPGRILRAAAYLVEHAKSVSTSKEGKA